MTKIVKSKDIKKDPRYLMVKKIILKEKKILEENGLDLSKQWNEMLKSIEK